MTTAYARLKLYDLLDALGTRAIYYDTDSCVFTAKPGEYIPPTGQYLGDLTNELEDGDYIQSFVSGGPKAYAYTTQKGQTVVKWKGITLNAKNAAVVTHDALKRLVDAFVSNPLDSQCLYAKTDTITRNKKTLHLKNASVQKRVRIVYNKRRVFSDYTTLPYGY